jgi:glutamate/tyrosine decarboxylase-like PLP-dependent enzyme
MATAPSDTVAAGSGSRERTPLPADGTPAAELRRVMEDAATGDLDWLTRMATGTNYPAGDDVLEVAKEAYLRFFSTNGLLPHTFPSLARFEREVIDYAAGLFHGPDAVGSITSGGSESILMGVKSARDRARRLHPDIVRPHMVLPESAHPAFTKAADYFGLTETRVPLGPDYQIDLDTYRAAVTDDTVLLAASAPSLTLGMVDPIEELAPIAAEREIGFHVDSCVGGFFLPFVEKLGVPIPRFDFRVPGVTTISADLHKFGYAAKGASLIMSRDRDVFEHQPFRYGGGSRPDDWYVTPSMTGTRPGGAIAAAWAVMHFLGAEGYRRIAATVMQARERLGAGLARIGGLHVWGEPDLWAVAYGAEDCDIHAVADAMTARRWSVGRVRTPPGIHLMLTPVHAPIVEDYLADLAASVATVRAGAGTPSRTPVVY